MPEAADLLTFGENLGKDTGKLQATSYNKPPYAEADSRIRVLEHDKNCGKARTCRAWAKVCS